MESTSVEVARCLADVLEANRVDYAIGGALAVAYYAAPRATIDVDINIFIPPASGLDNLLKILRSVGFEPDNEDTLQRSAVEEGQFRGRISGLRVDVFVPAFEFYASLARRKRSVTLLERPINVLGPDDLLILKMIYFRRKDLADVEAILRGPEELDLDQVRQRLIELVGEADLRIAEWDQLVRDTRLRPRR